MRKITCIATIVIALAAAAPAFADGPLGLDAIGVFGSLSGSTTGATGTGGIGLTLMWGKFPVLGLQYQFTNDNVSIGVALDYYIVQARLVDALQYYIAAGVYGGIAFGATTAFDFGIRVPIGLAIWPLKALEIYLGLIPMIPLLPSPNLNFGGELGFRVHF